MQFLTVYLTLSHVQSCTAQQTIKTALGGARALPSPSPRFIVCWVPPPRHTHRETFRAGEAGGMGGEPGFGQRGAAAVQPVAAPKTRVRVLFRRQAEEEYEEEMRHPADAGSSDGARCCRCAVPGASFLYSPAIHTQGNIQGRGGRRDGGAGACPGFGQRGAAAVQPAAALKTRVRVLFRRQAEEDYEEDMRHPADGGSSDGARCCSDGARCCRCAVPGASFLCMPGGQGAGVGGREKDGGDTPPVAPAVPVVERDAEGGGGGGLTDGPRDGQTNRGSNPRPRRAPAMAHTTRPSMPLTRIGAKIV